MYFFLLKFKYLGI